MNEGAAICVFWGKGSCSPHILSQTSVWFPGNEFSSVSLLFFFAGWLLCMVVLFLKKLKCAIWLKVSFFFLLLCNILCGSCYRMLMPASGYDTWSGDFGVLKRLFKSNKLLTLLRARSERQWVLWSLYLLPWFGDLAPETKGCQMSRPQADGRHSKTDCGAAAGCRGDTCFEMTPGSLEYDSTLLLKKEAFYSAILRILYCKGKTLSKQNVR